MFARTSRYFPLRTKRWTTGDGREVCYVERRFVPATPPRLVLAEHVVADGDRLDNVAAKYLGDPEQFWRLCDANGALHPEELTAEPGRRIRIPLPER